MTPQRIQRKRTRGWRMPEGAIYVGRPTKWGNPFEVGADVTRREAVDRFCVHLSVQSTEFRDWLKPLRGKNLACWCPLVDKDGNPVPCHADVLLELANQEQP